MSGSKRRDKTMSDQKKPPNLDLPPGQRAVGQGARAPETPAGDPKEKQADAPATSENEQKKAQAARGAEQEKKTAAAADGSLPPALQETQARHGEPPPQPAKLIRPGKDEGVPRPETPKAPTAKPGETP